MDDVSRRDELPAEVREVFERVERMNGRDLTLTVRVKELALLTTALTVFQQSLAASLKENTGEAVDHMVRMLTESGAVEAKVEALLEGAIREQFEDGVLPDLDTLMEAAGRGRRAPSPSDPPRTFEMGGDAGHVGQYL